MAENKLVTRVAGLPKPSLCAYSDAKFLLGTDSGPDADPIVFNFEIPADKTLASKVLIRLPEYMAHAAELNAAVQPVDYLSRINDALAASVLAQ